MQPKLIRAFSRLALSATAWLLWDARPVQARSAPPFIQDRAKGAILAENLQKIAKIGADSREINQRARQLLSEAYSSGGRRFQNNFPQGFHLDLSKPQFQKVASNLLRANALNWHGYERELKYLNVIAERESPFRIVSAGNRAPVADGRLVEFDALLEDKKSRMRVSAEFKDWRIDSPEKLRKAKEQIHKISLRAREQGVARSIWVNRARIDPRMERSLVKYAAFRRVSVYSPVSTSQRLARNLTKPLRFDDVLLRESRRLKGAQTERLFTRNLGTLPYGRLTGPSTGVIGAAYGLWETGHGAYQFAQGSITKRQAVMSMSEGLGSATGGGLGAWAGAEVGATVGTMILPGVGTVVGTVSGTIVGGITGALFGSLAGTYAGVSLVDDVIFKNLDEKEQESLMLFLAQYYQH